MPTHPCKYISEALRLRIVVRIPRSLRYLVYVTGRHIGSPFRSPVGTDVIKLITPPHRADDIRVRTPVLITIKNPFQ
jgi:hypothetical protein